MTSIRAGASPLGQRDIFRPLFIEPIERKDIGAPSGLAVELREKLFPPAGPVVSQVEGKDGGQLGLEITIQRRLRGRLVKRVRREGIGAFGQAGHQTEEGCVRGVKLCDARRPVGLFRLAGRDLNQLPCDGSQDLSQRLAQRLRRILRQVAVACKSDAQDQTRRFWKQILLRVGIYHRPVVVSKTNGCRHTIPSRLTIRNQPASGESRG